ncbi:helix-turn-helix domain-containing protein [Streptosporangium sp. NPDC048047]|uniref:helix-turn-helix domain-containing protein n=1 Tax=unclassified Streptosporangium TaxID=2632669 RepID=UPI003428971E
MYSITVRERVRQLLETGETISAISRQTGISRSTVKGWRDDPDRPTMKVASCPRCEAVPTLPEPREAYAYLLGLYLGDGYISPIGDKTKGVWSLRIICADSWPGLQEECAEALLAVRPDNKVRRLSRQGCTEINSFSKHWPHLFPQHGPGKKQDRLIKLEEWQQQIVDANPGSLVRGLMHSDGCRLVNRVKGKSGNETRYYEYPRYLFVNESRDILRLCEEALDLLDVKWRYSKPNTISVARREAVARLDEFVGPKY